MDTSKSSSQGSSLKDSEKPPSSSLLQEENFLKTIKPLKKREVFDWPKKEIELLKDLQVELASDLKRCHQLWEEFSPKKTLFDLWEFRLAFFGGYRYKPYFLLLKQGKTNLSLLPLWFDETRKLYTWFGSDWQEEVNFFTKDWNLIPLLLGFAPSPLYLNAISKESVDFLKEKIELKEDESKYILNLKNFRTHEDWLMTLKKNRRRDLRKDRNRILRQRPEIVIDPVRNMPRSLLRLGKDINPVRDSEGKKKVQRKQISNGVNNSCGWVSCPAPLEISKKHNHTNPETVKFLTGPARPVRELFSNGARVSNGVDNFADFENLILLSKKRFAKKGIKTDWEDPRRVKTFKEVIRLAGPSYRVRMIKIKIKEKTAGVDLIALYQDTYFALKCGYDVEKFPGIGNFMNLFEIDDAISLGMKKIDFLQNNYQWKERWFTEVLLFKYEKHLAEG